MKMFMKIKPGLQVLVFIIDSTEPSSRVECSMWYTSTVSSWLQYQKVNGKILVMSPVLKVCIGQQVWFFSLEKWTSVFCLPVLRCFFAFLDKVTVTWSSLQEKRGSAFPGAFPWTCSESGTSLPALAGGAEQQHSKAFRSLQLKEKLQRQTRNRLDVLEVTSACYKMVLGIPTQYENQARV